MNDKEIIEWGKEHYPQYLENFELIKSLYRRQVEKASVFTYERKYPFRRLKSIVENQRAIAKAIIVEIRRKGQKTKKWYSVILGDNSGMIPAMIFQDEGDEDVEEGQEYLFKISNRSDRGYSAEVIRKVDKDESLAIDSVYEYVVELNGGRVNKERFMAFLAKRNMKYETAMQIFNFKDDGDMIVVW